jgi:FkbM family methyltransferase
MLTESLRRLAARPDFRRNPIKAVAKRAAWRLRWLATSQPAALRLHGGFSIVAPKGAVGALIYYLGSSEPESARFIESFLQPGMVFFDVGAHIGEYTLIASRRVGPGGSVHAFEAQPDTFALLQRNCAANGVGKARLNACAVADREGELAFELCAEPAMSSIAVSGAPLARPRGRIRVPAISLDAYCRRERVWPDLVKIDVEGAERLVLCGAAGILRRPGAPALIFEWLSENYSRFGHSTDEVIAYLNSFGYRVFPMEGGYNVTARKA